MNDFQFPFLPTEKKMITLRPYQEELISQTFDAWSAGQRRVMLQSATGSGKTTTFSAIAQKTVEQGGRVLALAHRTELIDQGAASLSAITGQDCGIIQASRRSRLILPLQFASVQSIARRLDKVGEFDLIICDEAHHSPAGQYRKIYDRFPSAKVLGVSATPTRTDGSGFEDLFDTMIAGPSVKSLMTDGFLSKYKLFADKSAMNTKGVREVAGEFNQRQLAEANDAVELSGSLVESYLQHAHGSQCIAFAINVAHSKAIAQAYNAQGIKAIHLDGNTPQKERRKAIADFRDRKIQVVSNVALFTEGTDIPGIETVQIAKPTQSLALWLQMLGRGLRPAPGKEYATLIDHSDNYVRHGLPDRDRIWTLKGCVAEDDRLVRRKSDNQIVSAATLPLELVVKNVPLEHIKDDPFSRYDGILARLIAEQKARNLSQGWLAFKLSQVAPPLEVWVELARYAGHKMSWAKLMHNSAIAA